MPVRLRELALELNLVDVLPRPASQAFTVVHVAADGEAWRASRREAFELHVQAQRQAEEAASERVRPLLADFVRRAREQGLTPGPLRARSYSGSGSGSGTYRTGLRGWYLQPVGPWAVGLDGEFYVLLASPGPLGRLRGVELEPTPPPPVVGRGGRDGESMSLRELLERRLAAGNGFRRR